MQSAYFTQLRFVLVIYIEHTHNKHIACTFDSRVDQVWVLLNMHCWATSYCLPIVASQYFRAVLQRNTVSTCFTFGTPARLLCYDVVLIWTGWSQLYFHDACFIFMCTATDILIHNFSLIQRNMLFCMYVFVCRGEGKHECDDRVTKHL